MLFKEGTLMRILNLFTHAIIKRSNIFTFFTSALILSLPAFTASAESVQELRTMQLIRATYLEMKTCEGIEAVSGYPGDCSADLSHDFEVILPQLKKKHSTSDWNRIINTADSTRTLKVYQRLKAIAKETADDRAARAEAYQAQKEAEEADRQAERASRIQAQQDARNQLVSNIEQDLNQVVKTFEKCAQHYEIPEYYPAETVPCDDETYFYIYKEQVYDSYRKLSNSEQSRIDIALLQTAHLNYKTAKSSYFRKKNEGKKAEACKGTKGFFGKLTMSTYQRHVCKK